MGKGWQIKPKIKANIAAKLNIVIKCPRPNQGWKKPGLKKKKTSPVGFLGFFGFFWFFWFFGVFLPRRKGFWGFFLVSRILLGASRL
jgi:hypothetical protein